VSDVIVLLIAYLLLAWATGMALTFVTRMPWDLEGRLAMGMPLGFGAAALLTWLVAIPFGMSGWAVLAGAVLLVAILSACWRWAAWRGPLATEVPAARLRWRSREALPLGLLLALASVFFIPFYTHALKRLPDGLHAGYFTMLGDWAAHLGFAGYLSTARHVLPPQNPFFSGTSLNYPFLPDFFSGMLLHFGIGLEVALPLSSLLLSLALVVVFYSTALRLTGNRWAALIGALILFVGSGLGFTRLLDDIVPADPGPGGWIGGLISLVGSPPHEYTMAPDLSYQWLNPVLAYLLPQRATLFGWPLGLLGLSLLWHGWSQGARHEMLLAGLVVGLLPPFHANTYVALVVFAGGLALLSLPYWRDWLRFFVPAAILGGPLLLMLLPPANLRHSFLAVQLGWMASTSGHHDNILWFWLINTGLLIPLALATFLPGQWVPARLRRFLAPAWLLFIIPNILVLAPWDWDNTKFLVWWAIPASILAGLAVVRLARFGPVLAAVAALVVLVQVASGSLDLDRAWQEGINVPELRLLDNDGLALAAWAQANTPPDTVFLTGSAFNHPIRVMSGRVSVMSGLVTLWTTDIDYRARQQDVLAMYRGDAGAAQLLRHYGVEYVVIGPGDAQEVGADDTYYRARYPTIYRSPTGEYEVFRIT